MRLLHVACAAGVACSAWPAQAESLPLWEAGAGVAVIDFPHYRGSDQQHVYALPLPYLVYRGDLLRVDREGLRGMLFRSERAELDLSLNGSVPVRSADNRARAGMDDLDPTLEIGPSFNLHLARSADDRFRLDLRLPLRAVIASDFSQVRDTGWIFQPQLNVDLRAPFGRRGWNLGLVAGPVFANRRQHDYFYGVGAADATPTRPAFRASGGYSGSQFIAAISRRFERFWFGAYAKFDDLHGAAFEDSPLVRSRTNVTGGFGIAWVFAESTARVEAVR